MVDKVEVDKVDKIDCGCRAGVHCL